MIVSLKLKSGTEVEADGGHVKVFSSCAILYDEDDNIVIAYCLIPGEIVRRVEEGKYVVEY